MGKDEIEVLLAEALASVTEFAIACREEAVRAMPAPQRCNLPHHQPSAN